MGDFRDYVESYFRGGTGGAFGKDFSLPDSRNSNRFQSIDSRVNTGKKMEARIIDALKKHGMEIKPANISQDKYDKVDAFVRTNGVWLPLQIKYRDTGDEIAMEAMLNWQPDRFDSPLEFDGRDMVGKSKLYACLNQSGESIRVCSADEAKTAAKEAVKKLSHDYAVLNRKSAATDKAEARITSDPYSGRSKVMTFVKPAAMSSLQVIKMDRGLWAA